VGDITGWDNRKGTEKMENEPPAVALQEKNGGGKRKKRKLGSK